MHRRCLNIWIFFALLLVMGCDDSSAERNGAVSDTYASDTTQASDTYVGIDVGEICHGVPIDDPNHRCSGEDRPSGLPFVPDGRYATQGCSDPDLAREDVDGDGLSNGEEDVNGNCRRDLGETDWQNPDSDGDGLLDGEETDTDPNDPDSNDDGVPDGIDTANLDHGKPCPKHLPECNDPPSN